MIGRDDIDALLIAVPARDEVDRIDACVASLLAGVHALETPLLVSIVVASDDSTDGTDTVLDSIATREPRLHVVHGAWHSAAGARRAAIDHGLTMLSTVSDTPMHSIWIASTDADTVVPVDWLNRQIHHAESGIDAVAGVVDIRHDHDCSDELMALFAETYTLGPATHPHVHGANLGVRADAYLAVDGYPNVEVSEDHGLWNELRRGKWRVVSPTDVRVLTSARLHGRAVGGFADTLARDLASRSSTESAA